MESVEVNRPQPDLVATVRLPIPRRHVVATIALGVVLIVVMAFATGGPPAPSHTSSSYTTTSGQAYSDRIQDSVSYLQMVDAHHGGTGSDMAPFTARWLVPTIAGLLPLDPGVSLQLVNIVLLIAGMACLTLLISGWVRHSATLVVAVVLFSVAVPVLQSAGAYFVDAAAVGLVSIGIWAAYRLPLWAALAVLVVGVMAKETALILVAFGVTLELTRGVGTRRWPRAAAWCVTGGAAFLVARHVGASARLVFVPWLPHDVHYLELLLRFNLSRGDAWILTGLTLVVPIMAVVIAIWTSRRHWFRVAPTRLAPLAVGVGFAVLLSAWSATAASWEPRSAWLSLPFGVPLAALLVDAILDHGVRSTIRDRRFRRIVLATGALGFGFLVVAAVVSQALPFQAYQSSDVTPRLTATPLPSFDTVHHSGTGNATLRIPEAADHRPVLLDVDVPKPTPVRVETSGASGPLFDSRLDGTGTFLIDPTAPGATVALTVDGPWTARFRSLDTASRWYALDTLTGHGPDVVLIPGASRFSASAPVRRVDQGLPLPARRGLSRPRLPRRTLGRAPHRARGTGRQRSGRLVRHPPAGPPAGRRGGLLRPALTRRSRLLRLRFASLLRLRTSPDRSGPPRHSSLIVTELMMTSSTGRSCEPVRTFSIASRTSRPEMSLPNSEYWGGRPTPLEPDTMKNWLPLVLGPALAIASEPIWYLPGAGSSSSNR